MYLGSLPPLVQADVDSAKTLTLVALILYGIFGTIFVLLGFLFFLFIIFGVVPLLFLLLAYVTVYQPLSQGRPADARTPALVIGIISIFFGGPISGILLIIAYAKANSAYRILLAIPSAQPTVDSGTPTDPWSPPSVGPPPSEGGAEAARTPEYCPSCGARLSPEYRFCNNCGAQLR